MANAGAVRYTRVGVVTLVDDAVAARHGETATLLFSDRLSRSERHTLLRWMLDVAIDEADDGSVLTLPAGSAQVLR